VGPGNHVLDGRPDPVMGRGNFLGKGESHCKVREHCGHLCKTAELIDDAVWIVGSDGPKESCVYGVPDPLREGAIFEERGGPL